MRRLVVTGEGFRVPARLVGSGETGVLLAHGAGAGQDSDWMAFFRRGLAGTALTVMTFDYAYIAEGRKRPDPMAKLLAVHRAAYEKLAERVERVVLAGKSMGGRMGGHLATEGVAPAGLVFFGYPLVAIGKTEPRDTDHLKALDLPMLFVSGTRDPMGPLDLVRKTARRVGADLVVVEDGDHSLKVRKSSGRTNEEAWQDAIDQTCAWMARVGVLPV